MKIKIGTRIIIGSVESNLYGIVSHIYMSGNLEVEIYDTTSPFSLRTTVYEPHNIQIDKKYYRKENIEKIIK